MIRSDERLAMMLGIGWLLLVCGIATIRCGVWSFARAELCIGKGVGLAGRRWGLILVLLGIGTISGAMAAIQF